MSSPNLGPAPDRPIMAPQPDVVAALFRSHNDGLAHLSDLIAQTAYRARELANSSSSPDRAARGEAASQPSERAEIALLALTIADLAESVGAQTESFEAGMVMLQQALAETTAARNDLHDLKKAAAESDADGGTFKWLT
jgi:hypothetical protein